MYAPSAFSLIKGKNTIAILYSLGLLECYSLYHCSYDNIHNTTTDIQVDAQRQEFDNKGCQISIYNHFFVHRKVKHLVHTN